MTALLFEFLLRISKLLRRPNAVQCCRQAMRLSAGKNFIEFRLCLFRYDLWTTREVSCHTSFPQVDFDMYVSMCKLAI